MTPESKKNSFTLQDRHFMQRAIELARLGLGSVTPNPAVGAVLVHGGRIIGEGWHRRVGTAHAEVNAVASVAPTDRALLPAATLYVSLEPCCVYGRTPPCTELILRERIPRVVISQLDRSPDVYDQGVARLRAAGVEVVTNLLSDDGLALSLPRQLYVEQQRPLVLLKYARTADGFLAPDTEGPYWITHPLSRRLVHRWRTQTGAILIGGATARADNPALTARYFPGQQPLRVVVDPAGRLHDGLRLFREPGPLLCFTAQPEASAWMTDQTALQIQACPPNAAEWLPLVLQALYERGINHLTVEGGARVLNAFIEADRWDEAVVFTGQEVHFSAGLPAPVLPLPPEQSRQLMGDRLDYYRNPNTWAKFGGS